MKRFAIFAAALALGPQTVRAQNGDATPELHPLVGTERPAPALPAEAPGPDETVLDDQTLQQSCRAVFSELIVNPDIELSDVTVSTHPDFELICRATSSLGMRAPLMPAKLVLLRYILPGEEPVIMITVPKS